MMLMFEGVVDWFKGGRRQNSDAFLRLGRGRTIWIGGVLIFGGTMFVITTASDLIFLPKELHGAWEAGWLALSLLVWGIIGYVFGLFQWRIAMRHRPK